MESNGINPRSFFRFISAEYGSRITNYMKTYMNLNKKLARLINKQHFLLNCRREKVYPRTRILRNSVGIDPGRFNRLQDKFIFGIINVEIDETIRNIRRTRNELSTLHHRIEELIPSNYSSEFYHRAQSSFDYCFNIVKVRLKTKFENILNQNLGVIANNLLTSTEKWLVNISNVELPVYARFILSLGHKFCPPAIGNQVPFFRIISDVEGSIFNLDNDVRTGIRNRFINILSNFKNSTHSRTLNPSEKRILTCVKQTKVFLNSNPHLMVTKSDKGNLTVVTLRSDYIDKMNLMLSDRNTYQPIGKDNSTYLQTKINSLVREWENKGNIDETTRKQLTNYTAVIPRLYGLPKIHKENIPYRPIVSCIGSSTYALSAYLGKILKPSIGKTFSFIQNSEDLKNKIKNIIIPPNYTIISLDVTSLFTNVDNDMVLDIVSENWMSIKQNSKSKLTKTQFISGLGIVLNNSDFTFDNQKFKQIFGSPMGSPISPVLANLVMEKLEIEVLNSLDFRPLFYYRYVDDIITAVPTDKILPILNAFNSINSRIKFTLETEQNYKIPFLDVLMIRQPNGQIACDWYHKPTWSGRYLNFLSWLPLTYKINTVKILSQKILKLADAQFHTKNLTLLRNTLVNNDYPENLVNKIIRKQRNFHIIPEPHNNDENQNFLSIPYVRSLFEKIKGLFKNYNFKVVGRPTVSLNDTLFSKMKDQLPLKKQSNVVYQVECICNATYTGQTKQFLEKRLYQHISQVKSRSGQSCSALTQHLKSSQHTISLDNVKILGKQQNYNKRSVLEMLFIKSSQNSLNIMEDSAYIGSSYDLFI